VEVDDRVARVHQCIAGGAGVVVEGVVEHGQRVVELLERACPTIGAVTPGWSFTQRSAS
jgi:hypothetical protein